MQAGARRRRRLRRQRKADADDVRRCLAAFVMGDAWRDQRVGARSVAIGGIADARPPGSPRVVDEFVAAVPVKRDGAAGRVTGFEQEVQLGLDRNRLLAASGRRSARS